MTKKDKQLVKPRMTPLLALEDYKAWKALPADESPSAAATAPRDHDAENLV